MAATKTNTKSRSRIKAIPPEVAKDIEAYIGSKTWLQYQHILAPALLKTFVNNKPSQKTLDLLHVITQRMPEPVELTEEEKKEQKDALERRKVAIERLANPESYMRSNANEILQDTVWPTVADTTRAGFSTIGNIAGLPGDMLNYMASKPNMQHRIGPSDWDMLAGIISPVSNLLRNALTGVGTVTGDMIDRAAFSGKNNTLARKEAQRAADMNEVYLGSNPGKMSSAAFDYLKSQNTARNIFLDSAFNTSKKRVGTGFKGSAENYDPSRPPSDERLKNLKLVLSDKDMKDIEDICKRGEPYTEAEMELLAKAAGPMDDDHDFDRDGDMWTGDVLDKYAEHIQNYAYTYKPEAQAVDPSIDPAQKQIGPMAQDIEQVNPSCIVETEDGVKTVDTGKLALMNAGAIADLARRFDEIANMLAGE